MKINFSFCSNFAPMVLTCHLFQNLLFSVFCCAWEAIPISEFNHELANWVTIVMMFSFLGLGIMRPSVFFLHFYASTIFTGKMSRLVFRSEIEDGAELPKQATLAKPALSEASSLTADAWPRCPTEARGSPDDICESTACRLMRRNNKCLFKPLRFELVC